MKAPDFVEKGAGLLEIKIVVYLQGAKKEEKEMYFKRALSILLSCVLTFSTIWESFWRKRKRRRRSRRLHL